MYCIHCGKQIKDGTRFCVHCGMPQTFDEQETFADASPASSQEPAAHPQEFIAPVQSPSVSRRETMSMPAPVVLACAAAMICGLVLGAVLLGIIPTPKGVFENLPFSSGSSNHEEWGGKGESPDVYDGDEADDGEGFADDSTESDETPETGIEVRSSIGDYSWAELSQIATEIENCVTQADAVKVAQRYHLLDARGQCPVATKDVRLSDGTTLHMRLVGIWHDAADTPSGKAGLSLMTDGIVYHHRVASDTTTSGGWEASELRHWLRSDIYEALPSEVVDVIEPVYKQSNNVGISSSISCVSDTYDGIWVPSIVEVCGPVDWEYSSDPSNSSFYNAVFNAEGVQYEAFAQSSIDPDGGNRMLSFGESWWMRSTAASKGRGRFVTSDGNPSGFGDSNQSLGVVFGFCL